jgi:hypothetical protein
MLRLVQNITAQPTIDWPAQLRIAQPSTEQSKSDQKRPAKPRTAQPKTTGQPSPEQLDRAHKS